MKQSNDFEVERLSHRESNKFIRRFYGKLNYCQLFIGVQVKTKGDDHKGAEQTNKINTYYLIQNFQLYKSLFNSQYMTLCYEYDRDQGYFWVNQEYYTKTLFSLKPQMFTYCQKLEIITKLAKIIKFANDSGVCIRTLRPQLIGFHKYGQKSYNFKLIWMDYPTVIDQDGKIVPRELTIRDYSEFDIYVAPEIRQKKHYTTKADVWSFGVMFYELLFGTTADIKLFGSQLQIKFPNHTPTWLQKIIYSFLQLDQKKRCSIQQCLQHLKPMRCCAQATSKVISKCFLQRLK